jgi:hypothetical protein
MLDVIKKLDAGTIRGLAVATIPLLILIGSTFGLDEAVFKANLEMWAEKAALFVTLAGVAYAAWSRLFKPNPPLTETAVKETARLLKEGKLQTLTPPSQGPASKQGGYIRAGLLGLILALSVALPAVLALSGCQVLGVPAATGWNERLAGGYSLVTTVREAAGVRLDGQVAKAQGVEEERRRVLLLAAKADAQNLQDQADKAREGLDIARDLRGLNLGAAEERLTSTLRILEALQKYVEENP